MNKRISIGAGIAMLLIALLNTNSAQAKKQTIVKEIYPQAGTDTTYTDTIITDTYAYTHGIDVRPLAYSDDDKLLSGSFWPINGFVNSKYLEVAFNNSSGVDPLPHQAKIKRVKLVMEYTSTSFVLKGAMVKVFNGKNWRNKKNLLVPQVGIDLAQTVDITKLVKTTYRANNMSIRFLAYSQEPTQTAIDQMKMIVTYTLKR